MLLPRLYLGEQKLTRRSPNSVRDEDHIVRASLKSPRPEAGRSFHQQDDGGEKDCGNYLTTEARLGFFFDALWNVVAVIPMPTTASTCPTTSSP